jgi:hypothetical protein
VATQDCHKTATSFSNGHIIYGRFPIYQLRDPWKLKPLQCNSKNSPTGQNLCYTMFEYIPELESCTIGGAKVKSGSCFYFNGTPPQLFNEFDDVISTLDSGSFFRTQYFDYGRPGERTWNAYRIYRTRPDGTLQSKQSSPSCKYCYEKNLLNAVDQADPLIDGNPDPWLAPVGKCDTAGNIDFP